MKLSSTISTPTLPTSGLLDFDTDYRKGPENYHVYHHGTVPVGLSDWYGPHCESILDLILTVGER